MRSSSNIYCKTYCVKKSIFSKRNDLDCVNSITIQESIPIGCILPTCQSFVATRSQYGGRVRKWTSLNRSPPVSKQTHTTENITFTQLRWQEVTRQKQKTNFSWRDVWKWFVCRIRSNWWCKSNCCGPLHECKHNRQNYTKTFANSS